MAVKNGLTLFSKMITSILSILILLSLVFYLVPNEMIINYLGENSGFLGFITSSILGSIAMIPGFIVFPMTGLLKDMGISISIISVFITTLMMVGVVTLPLEIKYFGRKAAILRNLLSLIGALVVGLLVSFFWSYL